MFAKDAAPKRFIDGWRWGLGTYFLPVIGTLLLVVSGLWSVSDSLFGMYGNIDGKWTSWSTRGILEWSSFLDFGPYLPLAGTGSLFKPNLPWLNPGALALGIPSPLEYKHLISYIVYAIELSVSCYYLFRELSLSAEWAVASVVLYFLIFFIPMEYLSRVPTWFALAPYMAHLAASMNVATVALLRIGKSSLRLDLIWSLVFLVCVFSAFASAPVDIIMYIPVYLLLWASLCLLRIERPALLFRLMLGLSTAVLFWAVGAIDYMRSTAAVSARSQSIPAFLHPGTALLSVEYWRTLIARSSFCGPVAQEYLVCLRSPFGWIQLTALVGGYVLAVFEQGRSRAFSIFTILMIVLLHFYYLLHLDLVLGPVHLIGYHYLYWPFFPLVCAAAVMTVATACRHLFPLFTRLWLPAIASNSMVLVASLLFLKFILPNQPRVAGDGPLGLRPIARMPVHMGSIHRYLVEHAALLPGGEFKGYVGTYLGAEDGLVRKIVSAPADTATHEMYVSSREILSAHFGNMFQLIDLWNSNIPTVEEYGQWLTRQMFQLNTTFLALPSDRVDETGVATHVYHLVPPILRLLGVRFVIADGTASGPGIVLRQTELNGVAEAIRLYELNGANLGNYSPTRIIQADNYETAAAYMQEHQDRLENTVVLLSGASISADGLVPATLNRLTAVKGGYHLEALSSSRSLLILPIQFSHCWQLNDQRGSASVFRANMVQTGIIFDGRLDAQLLFRLPLWDAGCRLRDGQDMPAVLKRAN